MKLKSFGCSFIYGTDLADCDPAYSKNRFGTGNPDNENKSSNYTWPAMQAKLLGLPYECHAEGGIGNLRIMDRILENAFKDDPAIFVINWSWIDRFDYVDSNTVTWKTTLPSDRSTATTVYYRYFHSTYADKLNTLTSIKLAIDVLQEKKIPFIMTNIDSLLFDQSDTSQTIKKLQEFVKPFILSFEGLDFLNWSKANNYPISDTLHPLESAHAAAAEYLLPDVISRIQSTVDR